MSDFKLPSRGVQTMTRIRQKIEALEAGGMSRGAATKQVLEEHEKLAERGTSEAAWACGALPGEGGAEREILGLVVWTASHLPLVFYREKLYNTIMR